jgi:hypothetical protein
MAYDFVVGLSEQLVVDVGIQVSADPLAGTVSKRDDIHALCPSCCARSSRSIAFKGESRMGSRLFHEESTFCSLG